MNFVENFHEFSDVGGAPGRVDDDITEFTVHVVTFISAHDTVRQSRPKFLENFQIRVKQTSLPAAK
jgi:hypothetical protein